MKRCKKKVSKRTSTPKAEFYSASPIGFLKSKPIFEDSLKANRLF